MTRPAFAAAVLGLALLAGPARAQDTQKEPQDAPPVQVPAPSVAPAPAPALPSAPSSTPMPVPGAEDGRYTFSRVPDGLMRLDSRTGQVSLCGQTAGQWTCHAVPDERAALEAEIGRLQHDNATLKKELLARGLALPGGVKPDPKAEPKPESVPPVARAPDKGPEAGPRIPNEADVEKVMSFLESIWRRLVEMMAKVQSEMQRKS